jgi:hypothetical protein
MMRDRGGRNRMPNVLRADAFADHTSHWQDGDDDCYGER